MIVNPGIRRFLGSAIQRLFNSASVSLPLTHTAIPARGDITPSFTRATTETGQKWDEAGYLDFTALAGEIVLKGARRERNWFSNTENVSLGTALTNITVTPDNLAAPNGEVTADLCTTTATAATQIYAEYTNFPGTAVCASVYVHKGSGATDLNDFALYNVTTATVKQRATINYDTGVLTPITGSGVTVEALPNGWYRLNFVDSTFTAGQRPRLYMCALGASVASGKSAYVWGWQLEDVTGQTTQTASEYVSVGVESAPAYHGSMVDGVKCYDTDRSGNPITTTTTYDAVTLNGVAGTYVSTPDSVANSITGDIDIRVKAALADWTPAGGSNATLVSKWDNATRRSYFFGVEAVTGKLIAYTSADGSTLTNAAIVSTVATGFTDGAVGWSRMTYKAATGKFNFYTGSDGATWTQLGDADVSGTASAIFDSTSIVEIGSLLAATTWMTSGKIYQAQIYNGINGTLAVDFDASRYAGGTTLTGSTGETWTLNGSAVIHPTNYPIVGYVPWVARTNLCLQSNTLTTAPWADNGTTSATQNVVGPDGATSAWTLTDNDAGIIEWKAQDITLTAAAHTFSVFVKKTTGAQSSYPLIIVKTATHIALATIDTSNGVATAWSAFTGLTILSGVSANCVSFNSSFWRVSLTYTATAAAYTHALLPSATTNATQSTGTWDAAATGSAVFYGAQVELGSSATPYIPTTTVAVARNAAVDQYPTTAGPIAAAGSISLDFTPYHAPSGTIALWGTYVGASNYTAILHDATNLIFRKRIAGSNYDATIANAFVSGTTYKVAATWGAAGTAIYLDGVAGTPHANTTAAQIAATMQVGADGNSLQQPGAGTTNLRIWQRQLSSPEGVAVTA